MQESEPHASWRPLLTPSLPCAAPTCREHTWGALTTPRLGSTEGPLPGQHRGCPGREPLTRLCLSFLPHKVGSQ